MRTRTWPTVWSVLRLIAAALMMSAVVTQFVTTVRTAIANDRDVTTTIANFFSFFTILSNVIAAAVLTWAAAASLSGRRERSASLPLSVALACGTTYMIITGVVYNALLRGITLPQGSEPVPWSNEVLHLIGPTFLLLDLVIGTPRRSVRWRALLVIVSFPLLWTAYTLIRGPLVTNPTTGQPFWYPYPFLNPNNPGGWGMVIGYVVAIAVAFIVVGSFTVWVTRRRSAERRRPMR